MAWAGTSGGDPARRLSTALRRLAERSTTVTQAIPVASKANSARRLEEIALRARPGGGGVARAACLDELASHVRILLVAVMGHTEGLAALVESAEASRPYAQHSASAVVRAQIETAGQCLWLIDVDCSADERLRRWIIWRLDQATGLIASTRSSALAEEDNEATVALARRWIDKAVTVAESCGWPIRRGDQAMLYDDAAGRDRKFRRMPGPEELADSYFGAGIYEMLSIASHGTAWASLGGVEAVEPGPDGSMLAKITPFGFDLPLVVGLATTACFGAVHAFADWNGVDRHRTVDLERHRDAAQRAAKLAGWGAA